MASGASADKSLFKRHSCSVISSIAMASVDAGEINLEKAKTATKSLVLRDLPAHVMVGPMPVGSVSVTDLPLRDLDPNSPCLKHYVGLTVSWTLTGL